MKGKLKEVSGKLSDNKELEAETPVKKIAGNVQEKIGQVEEALSI